MVFGTFDNLHPGHLDYFKQAAVFGEKLIIVVARDKNVLKIKGRAPQEDEKERLFKARVALKYLEINGRAILGGLRDKWGIVRKFKPEIICLGYDQEVNLKALKGVIAEERFFCKIKRLKAYHPEKYKSSFCRGSHEKK